MEIEDKVNLINVKDQDNDLESIISELKAQADIIKTKFNNYITTCNSYELQEQRKKAYFQTTNLLETTIREIQSTYENYDKKYSKGWVWGGKEICISDIEKGFYKLPSKYLQLFQIRLFQIKI